MNKFVTNPFDRTALKDVKLLAGRNLEFRQVRFLLRNAFKQENRIKSIMICGDRGVGKTSFLNLIEIECSANNIIPIRLNLTETNTQNSNEFFWNLFSRTLNVLYNLDYLGGVGGDIQNAIQKIINSEDTPEEVNWVFKTPFLHKNYLKNRNTTFEFDLLIEDLKLARKQIIAGGNERHDNKTKFLFLVDEAQNIYTNTKLIEEIRFIIQNQDLGFGFVFAGDSSYEKSQWDIVFGGAHREFEIINLNYFDDVDGVKEYFRKSLESVDWTANEIEKDLFYRFHHACMQIFVLTSGKPAWINEIAQKMFERCMKGESSILRFDRNAQNDVRNILLNSGQIDRIKLDVVDTLSPKYKKWLAKLFACELSSLRQVYFYAKFILTGENSLSFDEYSTFCQKLIDAGVIILRKTIESRNSIGYQSKQKSDEIFDIPYFAFGNNSDSIKLWLQINSDGKYRFRVVSPDFTFVDYINNELSYDSGNAFIIGRPLIDNYPEEEVRISKAIESINLSKFDIVEAPYNFINIIYKLLKRLTLSKNGQILFIQLRDNVSHKLAAWNIYNTNEHDHLIDFSNSSMKIQKLKSIVEYYNTPEINFSLEIYIDHLSDPNIERFQNLIIKSGDAKKRGIVIEDKMASMVKYYIDEHNVDSSYNVARFIYNLFEEGHDLSIRDLNNTAYVFIVKDELQNATALLKEVMKKISNETLERDETGTAALAIYNTAIVAVKEGNYLNALKIFKKVVAFCEEHEKIDDLAGALYIVEINDNKIITKELHVKDTKSNSVSTRIMADQNIATLELFFEDNKNR